MQIKIQRLMMITSGTMEQTTARLHTILTACQNGLPALQLREKSMESKDLLSLAATLRKCTAENGVFFTINSRLDIALAVGADGVHLTENGLSPALVKKVAPSMVTGVSTHSLDTSLRAEQEGADYVIFGPIFPTASKAQFGAPQGLGPLKVVCSRLKIPVIAVGGISPNETNNCYKAGAYGIACINALLLSQDIKATINRFLNPETVVHIDKVMSEEENK